MQEGSTGGVGMELGMGLGTGLGTKLDQRCKPGSRSCRNVVTKNMIGFISL